MSVAISPDQIDREVTGGVRTSRWAATVVWSVLVAMTLILLGHIARYGHNVPLAEDWNLVPALIGEEPDFWSWVWSQNNEHRLPVARLISLGLLQLTGDFRAGMVLNTLLMAALAGGFILLARLLRGRTSIVDAFFPVALLHLGHWENLLWSWQLQLVLVTAAIGALLILLVRSDLPIPSRMALLLAGVTVFLPFGGGTALPMVPAALVGVVAIAWLPRAGTVSRRILLAAVGLTLALTGVYFVGWQEAAWYPDSPGVIATLRATAKVLALAWGPAAEYSFLVAVAATVALLASAVAVLARGLWHDRSQRGRAVALLCILGGVGLTALAIGYGRAGTVATEGLPDRYVIVALPALLVAWFAWQLFGPARARRVVHAGLLAVVVALLPLNTTQGYSWRNWYAAGMEAVERDLRAGAPIEVMVERHGQFLMHWDDDLLAERMAMLQRAAIGPFADLQTDAAAASGGG